MSAGKAWHCDICGAAGREPTSKGAGRAWDRHYYLIHGRDGES